MQIEKSYHEINEKIRKGEAVVLTAEEVARMAETASPEEIAQKVDVVTTATFGAMCSSGAFINFGHANPPIRMEKIRLNGVPAYEGLAAVDTYIGATASSSKNPQYGGAHVIQDLIEGKDIVLEAWAKGTDCYPRKHIKTIINKNTVNEMFLFNPRNAYQNYNVAVNTTRNTKYTYMGTLLPNMRNATYSTSGELSPLLNDPEMKTIGIGTRIFIGGTTGYVAWPGTQFHTTRPKDENGVPVTNAATLAVIGNLKEMSSEFLRAAYYEKYGVSMFVGIGIPIPILNAEMARRVSINNRDIKTSVLDYGSPGNPKLGEVTYEQLRSGTIEVNGQTVRTAPVASLNKARQIAEILKKQIQDGSFMLQEPVQMFPNNTSLKGLKEVGFNNKGGEQ
ncbi:MAG TPA: homocysteine biosynthesis protein [Prolixibacteraceae bacterium]|nr:homocysteine biosynthesis protein [Prolixibacteraceae bacterium]HPR60780.1 homocysteine biosynthesis protein [Prolixibacteraceae bacterium]